MSEAFREDFLPGLINKRKKAKFDYKIGILSEAVGKGKGIKKKALKELREADSEVKSTVKRRLQAKKDGAKLVGTGRVKIDVGGASRILGNRALRSADLRSVGYERAWVRAALRSLRSIFKINPAAAFPDFAMRGAEIIKNEERRKRERWNPSSEFGR